MYRYPNARRSLGPLLRLPRVQAFRDSEEAHQADGTGRQRSEFIKDLNARIHIEGQSLAGFARYE